MSAPEQKARVALLYFPLVQIAVDSLPLLFRPDFQADVMSSSTDANDADLEIEETRELLMTALFVLRHCHPKIIRHFLTSNAEPFFRMLQHSVRVFEYTGQLVGACLPQCFGCCAFFSPFFPSFLLSREKVSTYQTLA